MAWEYRELRGGRARYDMLAPPVQVGERMAPREIFVELHGDGKQPSLEMKIEVREGVPVCAELRLVAQPDGYEIRPKDLKAVHIDSWIEQVVGLCSSQQIEPGLYAMPSADRADYEQLTQEARKNAEHARRPVARRGRPTVPRERLAKVAELYRRNVDNRPYNAIGLAFGVTERTAMRWVQMSRELQLLPKVDNEEGAAK